MISFRGLAFLPLLAAMAAAQGPKIPDDQDPVTTASGLVYSFLAKGPGEGAHPKLGDSVTVHYTGWLENGVVFDSSANQGKPMSFKVGQVIEGWNEGLTLMKKGDRVKLTIPGELAYGKRGSPPRIPPNATLIFEVELLEIAPGPPMPEFHAADEARQKTTESGLKHQTVKPGRGATCRDIDLVSLTYAYWDKDGRLVDCSELSGGTIRAQVRQMPLPFLKEAAELLAPGARFRFEVPPAICFGEQAQGRLPPNSTTIWELQLEKVILSCTPSSPEDVQTTASGLKYEVLKQGEGDPPAMGQQVTVNYAGWLEDGDLFDSSFARGTPATFALGRVIDGWNEGLQLMRPGAAYRFTIPAELAYKERGFPPKIGPNATLIFYVELLEVAK